MDLLLAFIIAMVVTMALIPPLARAAGRLHVLDNPESRKVHSQPIPRVGGIAMMAGVVLPLCLWLPMGPTLLGYLLAAIVLFVFGTWDDRVNLGALTKISGQLIAVLIIMLVGHVSIDSMMLDERVALPHWFGFGLTLLFLLGITNAINLSDGLDGLAGGMTLLCCAALALLAANWDVRFVETVGIVLMGATLGFLRFNTYPARIFMGDVGSEFLGFSVGVLSILLTKQAATPLSTALPLLLIGLPVLDTLTVIVLRLHAGRSPFSADRHHFHHRLLDLGFDHYEVVIVVYAVQCLLLLLAWQLRYENDLLIVASFVGFAVLFTGGFMLLERAGWRWRIAGAASHPSSPLVRLQAWLRANERFSRWSMRVVGLCAMVYLLGVALYAEPVPRDIGWLSAALCLLPLLLSARGPRSAFAETWLVRGALYVAVIVAVYLDQGTSMQAPLWRAVKYAFLPLLAVSVVLGLRLSAQRRFEATPLDLLLIFGALALPNLPGLAAAPSNFGLSAAKLVVLCYAVEMIAVIGSRLRTALLGTAGVFYLLIAVRAFS
jgi:UDP-GlcNAc:undecaprenyl-phosphate/decaprenyl-phosphate GlcNAc-1-phosphate transferase